MPASSKRSTRLSKSNEDLGATSSDSAKAKGGEIEKRTTPRGTISTLKIKTDLEKAASEVKNKKVAPSPKPVKESKNAKGKKSTPVKTEPQTPPSGVRRSGRAPVPSRKYLDMDIDTPTGRKRTAASVTSQSEESDVEQEQPKKRTKKLKESGADVKLDDPKLNVSVSVTRIKDTEEHSAPEANKSVKKEKKIIINTIAPPRPMITAKENKLQKVSNEVLSEPVDKQEDDQIESVDKQGVGSENDKQEGFRSEEEIEEDPLPAVIAVPPEEEGETEPISVEEMIERSLQEGKIEKSDLETGPAESEEKSTTSEGAESPAPAAAYTEASVGSEEAVVKLPASICVEQAGSAAAVTGVGATVEQQPAQPNTNVGLEKVTLSQGQDGKTVTVVRIPPGGLVKQPAQMVSTGAGVASTSAVQTDSQGLVGVVNVIANQVKSPLLQYSTQPRSQTITVEQKQFSTLKPKTKSLNPLQGHGRVISKSEQSASPMIFKASDMRPKTTHNSMVNISSGQTPKSGQTYSLLSHRPQPVTTHSLVGQSTNPNQKVIILNQKPAETTPPVGGHISTLKSTASTTLRIEQPQGVGSPGSTVVHVKKPAGGVLTSTDLEAVLKALSGQAGGSGGLSEVIQVVEKPQQQEVMSLDNRHQQEVISIDSQEPHVISFGDPQQQQVISIDGQQQQHVITVGAPEQQVISVIDQHGMSLDTSAGVIVEEQGMETMEVVGQQGSEVMMEEGDLVQVAQQLEDETVVGEEQADQLQEGIVEEGDKKKGTAEPNLEEGQTDDLSDNSTVPTSEADVLTESDQAANVANTEGTAAGDAIEDDNMTVTHTDDGLTSVMTEADSSVLGSQVDKAIHKVTEDESDTETKTCDDDTTENKAVSSESANDEATAEPTEGEGNIDETPEESLPVGSALYQALRALEPQPIESSVNQQDVPSTQTGSLNSQTKSGDKVVSPDKWKFKGETIKVVDNGIEFDVRVVSSEDVAEEVIGEDGGMQDKTGEGMPNVVTFKAEPEDVESPGNEIAISTSSTQTLLAPSVGGEKGQQFLQRIETVTDEDGQKKQVYYVSVFPGKGMLSRLKSNQGARLTHARWVLSENGMYCCGKCDYKTDRKANFYKHRRLHVGTKPHVCPICDYKAGTSSNLKRHMGIHKDIREHKCDICGLSFRQKIHLERHVKYKHEEKSVQCPLCDYVCANEQPDLKMHMKRKHGGGKVSEVLSCPECHVEVGSKKDLKQHMKFHKEGPELKLFCKECSFVTDCQSRLRRHSAIHSKLKPFQCGVCNYRAAQKEHVLRHLRTQHKIEVKKEPKKAWKSRKQQQEQEDVKEKADFSSGDKIFACNHCTMRFAKLINLYKHLHTQHSDIMPPETSGNFYCVVCEFSTTTKKNLLVHMRRHNMTDQTPPSHVYSCVLCRYVNPKRRNLFQHMRKKHNIDISNIGEDESETQVLEMQEVIKSVKEGVPSTSTEVATSSVVTTTSASGDGITVIDMSENSLTPDLSNFIKIEDLSHEAITRDGNDDISSLVIDTAADGTQDIHTSTANSLLQQQHSMDALEGLQALAEQAGLIEEQVHTDSVIEQQDVKPVIIESSDPTTEGLVEVIHAHENGGDNTVSVLEAGVVQMEGEGLETSTEMLAGGSMELSEEQLSSLRHGDMVEMEGELYMVELSVDPDQPDKQMLSFVPVADNTVNIEDVQQQ